MSDPHAIPHRRYSHGLFVVILLITGLVNLIGSLGFSRMSLNGYKSEEYPRYFQSHMVFAIMYMVVAAGCLGFPRYPEVRLMSSMTLGPFALVDVHPFFTRPPHSFSVPSLCVKMGMGRREEGAIHCHL